FYSSIFSFVCKGKRCKSLLKATHSLISAHQHSKFIKANQQDFQRIQRKKEHIKAPCHHH
ncbi:hypothetical protein, partial [Streptococcus ruminantium]|uniref:hypothetical protein n=1 Tax=Streptococcus ruminantium TaxID=1917441 RepID=UPI001D137686